MVWVQNNGAGSVVTLDPTAAPLDTPADEAADELPVWLADALEAVHQGDLGQALPVYQQVMGLDGDGGAAAMLAAGLMQALEGEKDAAEWLLRRSLTIAQTTAAYNHLGHLLLGRRQWDAALACYRASLALDPTNLTTWPNLLFGLDLHPGASWQIKLAERRRFNDLHCKPLTDAAAPHTNDPDPERVLRVGYLSADWKQHSAAHGFGPVVKGHRRDRFEVHLYDVDQQPENPDDLVSVEFQTLPDTIWHDVRGYDDATLAATIRADGIDILVDLSGYSGGGRPLAFARKPAPIQVSGFGYATGLGIDAMDYLIADEVLIPERHREHYHEKPLYLPSFMGYEQAPPWPDVGPPPKERNGYTTYGYLGRTVKISPQAIAVWSEILHRDSTARLLLKGGEYADERLATQIREGFSALGVTADRLEIRAGSSRYAHLEAYNDVDVMLDPFPHNGGVTTVEAVLMGVPPITLLGDYVCGRVGASLLTSFGFKGAIARTPFEYVNHALSVSADTWTLHDRQSLRNRACNSIMMDADVYATAVEEAYRAAWRIWCAEQDVKHIYQRTMLPGD